jgi:hypothetical protein
MERFMRHFILILLLALAGCSDKEERLNRRLNRIETTSADLEARLIQLESRNKLTIHPGAYVTRGGAVAVVTDIGGKGAHPIRGNVILAARSPKRSLTLVWTANGCYLVDCSPQIFDLVEEIPNETNAND